MGAPVVTCVGGVTLDVIAVVDTFPEREGRMEAESITVTGGGPAANAAVVLARQGVETAFVGLVGDDEAGHQALDLLQAEGIDVSGCTVDAAGATQTSCIIVDRATASRSIITTGAAPLPTLTDRARRLVAASRWVHTDHRGYTALREALAATTGPRVSLDSGNAPVPALDLATIDLYVPTASSLRAGLDVASLDAAASAALDQGCHAVVATDGRRGATGWWDAEGATYAGGTGAGSTTAPAYDDVTVVSTLGAGDVFHGALLSALCHGRPWDQALAWANVTAGLACEGVDGRQAVPTAERVTAVLDG